MQPPVVRVEQLRHEQIRLLARNVPAMAMGSTLLGAGAVTLLHLVGQSLVQALVWFALNTSITLVRLALSQGFLRRENPALSIDRWAMLFLLSSGLAGAWWGALAWWFLHPQETVNLAVIAIVLMGSVSGATQSQGPYFASHLAYTLPCTLPFTVRCFASADPIAITLGGLGVVYLVMAVLFSLRIDRTVVEALRLRLENEALVAEVSRARDASEAASRAKTRFLATASHDLRQPIHAMGLFVPALKAMAGGGQILPATLMAVADRMKLALQTMSQLLGRLLDVSRLDAGVVEVRLRNQPLAPMLLAALDEITSATHAKGLDVRVRESGLQVHTDPAVLHAILSNLLANAVRYTKEGAILVAARRRGGHVLLQVWDTGIGIAPDDQVRLSEEFFQGRNALETGNSARGFGLGLAIAQRSAQLLGSELRWRSQLGRGSVFELLLPLAIPQGAAHAPLSVTPASPQPSPTKESLLVLVVDQEEDILASTAFLLKAWGHQAVQGRSLQEVAAVVAEHGTAIRAGLIDYHLCATETGLQVAQLLRQEIHPDLPIAIVTGDTTPDVMAAVRGAGLILLHKPVHAQTIQSFVNSLQEQVV
ncbi:MAG: hybrid sensor histidine kinase/response regulator [Hydrogenophaga sp.]|uniref:hybrid sensor histidine kinase/response regulator n=1 Tax=Hydrogenophaga sp. TaxID=1904254 RepID=UPI001D5B0886|nr:hybrid sensor histidine kinase/response regulator [Hydrogenophaga sp.]MBX3611577.1 hybrid sensor histidine kinase/response regulator [Hydrogenophaga sp.]